MHKPESVQENKMHTIVLDFEIQTDYRILARRPDLVLIIKRKRTSSLMDFAIPADPKVKIKWKDKQILRSSERNEKVVEF